MRLQPNARRLVLGMTASLAVTLAACSGSGGSATTHTAATKAAAAAGAAAPATSAPAAPKASGLSGRWSGHYSGAYSGTFVLRWHQSGSRLNGLIKLSNPGSTVPIHGKVSGGSIRFGTVGSMAITYSGSVSGNSMSGTYQVHTAGGTTGGPWSAHKSS